MRIIGVILLCSALLAAPASGTVYYFTNADGNNDFDDLDNWNTSQNGSGSKPTTFATHDFFINISGANRAELSLDLPQNPDDVEVGNLNGTTGELLISGGTHTIVNRFRPGLVAGSTGIVTMSGGTLNVLESYTTIATAGNAIFTMTGGIINADRITWGQNSGVSCTLAMSAGTININTTDPTPTTSSGSLRMGAGNTNLNISGTAAINAEKLYIAEGGSLNLTGGTVQISGSEDAEPTFNFTEATIGSMLGKILYNGGQLLLDGDHESLFDAAIAGGAIYTTEPGMAVDAQYVSNVDQTHLVLQIIPEPATLALLALVGLVVIHAAPRRRTAPPGPIAPTRP